MAGRGPGPGMKWMGLPVDSTAAEDTLTLEAQDSIASYVGHDRTPEDPRGHPRTDTRGHPRGHQRTPEKTVKHHRTPEHPDTSLAKAPSQTTLPCPALPCPANPPLPRWIGSLRKYFLAAPIPHCTAPARHLSRDPASAQMPRCPGPDEVPMSRHICSARAVFASSNGWLSTAERSPQRCVLPNFTVP